MTSKHTVLVVDDKKDIADGYARILEDDYTVKTAYRGEEALEMLDEDVDVILLDRKMPDMSGNEVAERIAETRFDPQIIMVTSVEPSDEILEMRIDDYLPKPVSVDNLKEVVKENIEVAEYDEATRDFFALSSKRDVLVEETDVANIPGIEEEIEKKAKKGLEKSRSKLETVIQSSPVAIVSLDSGGKVNIWNHAAEQMFGWSAGEVEGNDLPVFDLKDNEKLDRVRSQVFSGREVTDIEVEGESKEGAKIQLSLSAAPLVDPDGEIYGTIFILSDITDRKQRQQRLRVLDRVLRHNLRNNLNVIIGRAKDLLDNTSGENQDHARTIKQLADELMELGDKAREAERALEDEKDGMRKVDVVNLIEKQIRKIEREYSGVDIEFERDSDELDVYSSKGLGFAIRNMIENSIEHNDGEPVVRVGLETVEDKATISIDDNGPGIPESELRVFLEGQENPLEHGSGLGLWTTKWIVERAGGSLDFGESDLGGAKVLMTVLTDG